MKTIEQLRKEAIGVFIESGDDYLDYYLLMRLENGKVDLVSINQLGVVGYMYNIPIENGKVQLCDVTTLRVTN